jgi:dihydroorotate dehydrogenase electron transfer subunit
MIEQAAASAPVHPTQFAARVLHVRSLCREHHELVLACDDASAFAPGRFLQITSTPDQLDAPALTAHEWNETSLPALRSADLLGRRPLLRRPYSPADVWREADGSWRIALVVRVVGPGTAHLARREVGDVLSVIGPIGNRFAIGDHCTCLLLAAGGTGIAPMIYLAKHLRRQRGEAAPRMVAFFGAATRDLICCDLDRRVPRVCVRQFADAGVESWLSTDDGSLGFRGFVTQLVEAWLERARPDPAATVLCAVGPDPMMAAAARLAGKWALPVQVSLERKMGCGLGTCQSCVVPILTGEGGAWQYRLTCKDGPVFDGRTVLWTRERGDRPAGV